ncbi:hypothetical protein HBH45_209130 [Parastagonospora nodorum]|nr:hypothetical protein HBH45_209130 [Parastagonospora nodorum]KAH4558209.1 hypothetical protein HBH84_219020 [Parastagonospora nodorum]KAH4617521.1 hypothetical protein HBH55_192780 [Parastagonospora nodorum]KAH6389238.1 hypothetical protein HBI60_192660 [Parastagonospora nodorum]KAH6451552.1 hypothetical protein HBI57_169820 [Parastagonospora nodorum]
MKLAHLLILSMGCVSAGLSSQDIEDEMYETAVIIILTSEYMRGGWDGTSSKKIRVHNANAVIKLLSPTSMLLSAARVLSTFESNDTATVLQLPERNFDLQTASIVCTQPRTVFELVNFDKVFKEQVNRMVQRANEGLV